MRFERTTVVLVLATGVMLGGLAAAAEPVAPPAPKPPMATPAPDPDDVRRPPSQAEKVGTVPWSPAELKPEHAVLKQLVGHFKTKVHVYEGPYKRLFDTEGTAEGKLLMDGAFVQLTHSELRMKMPFETLTIYGFDTALRKYTADSIDNASTAIIHLVGTYNADKELTMTGRFMDQKARTTTLVRTVITFVDDKTWTYTEFESHSAGGTEKPVVTIQFTRP